MADDSSGDSDEEIILLELLRRNARKEKRTEWVNAVNKKRKTHGQFRTLVMEELSSDTDKFYNYFRMTQDQFETLLDLIKDDICKQDTTFRESISARERLAICIRFLATGDSYASLHYNFRVGKSTISELVSEVCDAIWARLKTKYMAEPTQERWLEIAEVFGKRWNLPNCVGPIDGKHVIIKAPPNSGSLYHNYKGTHSIVLMALVDSDYNFTVVDVGAYGSSSDGGIFSRMALSSLLAEDKLNIPPARELPDMPELGPVPHFIVGDEAFPLRPYLRLHMPKSSHCTQGCSGEMETRDSEWMIYAGRNLEKEKRLYNYRHSRARRISENAFAILASKFRLYHRKLEVCPNNADKIVLATCVLHNFIRKTGPVVQAQDRTDEQEESQGLLDLERTGHHSGKDGLEVREALTRFVNSTAGAVYWQDRVCFGHAK